MKERKREREGRENGGREEVKGKKRGKKKVRRQQASNKVKLRANATDK